jgi:hypothetical protein
MLGRTVLLLRFTLIFLGVTRSWIDSLSHMSCTTVDFVRSLIGPFVTAAHPFLAQHLWHYVSLIQTSKYRSHCTNQKAKGVLVFICNWRIPRQAKQTQYFDACFIVVSSRSFQKGYAKTDS